MTASDRCFVLMCTFSIMSTTAHSNLAYMVAMLGAFAFAILSYLTDQPIHPLQLLQCLGNVLGMLSLRVTAHTQQLQISLRYPKRVADFMGEARSQPAHRGQFFRTNHFPLIILQLSILLGKFLHRLLQQAFIVLDPLHHTVETCRQLIDLI